MKILCCCAGGNTRSVTLATLLKYWCKGSHDALSCALEKNTPDTLGMLFRWADRILVVEKDLWTKYIPPGFDEKVVLIDLPVDKWGMSMHPDLIPLAMDELEKAYFPLRDSADVFKILAYREKYRRRQDEEPVDRN